MKKNNRTLQVAAILIGMAIGLCGCGADDGADQTSQNNVSTQGGSLNPDGNPTGGEEPGSTGKQNTGEGFFFHANGVRITVDMDMDELAGQIGESKSIFEAPSCAGEGISYLYDYSSYEIETYPSADGKNRIGYIVLKDDLAATEEGIDLSMTKQDVIRIYGEEYEESANGFTYEKQGMKLNFVFDGDNIISIEYVSAVLG